MPGIDFQPLVCVLMRIGQGCQGRLRRLYSLDSLAWYAYTLAAVDRSGSRAGLVACKYVKEGGNEDSGTYMMESFRWIFLLLADRGLYGGLWALRGHPAQQSPNCMRRMPIAGLHKDALFYYT